VTDVWRCSRCGIELTEKYHVNGRDYCREHKPTPRPSVWDESVRGIVIGGDDTTHYQFWQGKSKVAEYDAQYDGEAIRWFKAHYPVQYSQGAEMRAFDV